MKRQPDHDTGNPEKGQIRATEIMRHVMETRTPFELPDSDAPRGTVDDVIFRDTPAFLDWDERPWCSVTKKEFARLNATSQAQVSRWLAAGLPQQSDGRLNYFSAFAWVERYEEQCEFRRSRGWKE